MQVPSPVPMPTWKHPWLRFYNVAKFHEWRAWFLACPLKIWIQTLQDWMHCPEFWGLRLFIFLNTMPGRLWFLDVFCIFLSQQHCSGSRKCLSHCRWCSSTWCATWCFAPMAFRWLLRGSRTIRWENRRSLVLSEHLMHVAQFYKRCDFIGSWKGPIVLYLKSYYLMRSPCHDQFWIRWDALKHHQWSRDDSPKWSICNVDNI